MTEWTCPRCSRTVTVDGNHLDEVVAIAACADRHTRAHRAAAGMALEPPKRASRPTGTGQGVPGDPAQAPTPGKGTLA